MADHSHHNHHAHHAMDNTSDLLPALPTAATTLVQAVMTTVMSHAGHQDHHQPSVHSHHSMQVDHGPPPLSDVHSTHIGEGMEGHMKMYFHFGEETVILFKEWVTSTPETLIFSCIGIIILAMLYEGLKFFREFLFKKYFTSLEYSSVSVLGDDGKPITEVHKVARNRMLSWPHFSQTGLHLVQMTLSYFPMLIVMTYNVWLFAAVVLGSGFGYFLFGWKKATVVDITEHCH